ncbi:hypothetical protein M0804_001692 [Polistes exclamans]|nr:hypothetical protein M0804_001692 [Polistes exclamans]
MRKGKRDRVPGASAEKSRDLAMVGATLDKRRGLLRILTPRVSTEKQPLSSTSRPSTMDDDDDDNDDDYERRRRLA